MMSVAFSKKALREIANARENPDFDFFVDDIMAYSDEGDEGSCYLRFCVKSGFYEGQVHILRIKFVYGQGKYSYPMNPPNIVFVTPIYHTNIALAGGSICLDVIKTDAWSPMYGLNAIFSSIVLLLDEPNVLSPFNNSAATDYRNRISDADYAAICRKHYDDKLRGNKRLQQLLEAPEFDRE